MSKKKELSYEDYSELRKQGQLDGTVPEWMQTAGLQMFMKKYLYEADNPKQQFERIAKTLSEYAPTMMSPIDAKSVVRDRQGFKDYWGNKFFNVLWKGYLACSTPLLANTGTDRGLPVSCSGGIMVEDSVLGFSEAATEVAMLTKHGFGTAVDLSNVRYRGAEFKGGGKAGGVVPVANWMDFVTTNVSQGSCYSDTVEVLTEKGYMLFKDALEIKGLKVAQVDDDEVVSFVIPSEWIINPYRGDMIHYKDSKNIDLLVTPNHRMIFKRDKRDTNGKFLNNKKITTKEFYESRADEMPTRDIRKLHGGISLNNNTSGMTTLEKLEVAFQADGSYVERTNKKSCTFRFNKERKVVRLRKLLEDTGICFTESKYENGVTAFYVKHAFQSKTFSSFTIIGKSQKWCEDFLEEVSEWDGSKVGNKANAFAYNTIIKENADFVQAVASISGKKSYLKRTERDSSRQDIFNVYVSDGNYFGNGSIPKKEVVTYNGIVYCCTVPTGKLIVRNNGRTLVCGNSRRGAVAVYLDIHHKDFYELADFLQHNPDKLNVGWKVNDKFIERLENGNKEAHKRYAKALYVKSITGKGYFHFIDKSNRLRGGAYEKSGLNVSSSQLCNEIMLHSDKDHTYICTLAWMNLSKYDEWKDTDAIFVSTVLLDCVNSYFIEQAKDIKGLEKAVLGAIKGRPVGLGAGGLHSLFQQRMMPFESPEAYLLNKEIFEKIDKESLEASKALALSEGEPEWCKGLGIRFTHRCAVAPTKSTALIYGGISEGGNPDAAYSFTQSTAAGEVARVMPVLLALIKSKGLDTESCIADVEKAKGSVQHVSWLTEKEKSVFKTGFEVPQEAILRLASSRQRYIDQGQSLNLFIDKRHNEEYISQIHQLAFKDPYIKGLYYLIGKREGDDAEVVEPAICESCM